jgi:hypothetical protein
VLPPVISKAAIHVSAAQRPHVTLASMQGLHLRDVKTAVIFNTKNPGRS